MSTLRFVLVRVAVLALLVAAAVGLRAGSPLDADSSRWRADRLLSDVPTGSKVVGLLLLAGILLFAIRCVQGSGGPPRRNYRGRILRDFVVLAGFLLLALAWPDPHRVRRYPPLEKPPTEAPGGVSTHQATASHRPLLLVLALAVLAVVAIVLAARRRSADVEQAPVEDLPPAVSEGLAAAARVLRERPHEAPRELVLSAYEAFEQALAARGIARGPSGTATALLSLAVEAGAPTEPAEALTRLFGAARFSDEPVTEQDVAAAERALDVLLASR